MNWYKKIVIAAGIPPLSSREFAKTLEELGATYLREGKGDHRIYYHPVTKQIGSFPYGSGGEEINPRTMTKAVEDMGIPKTVFIDYLRNRKGKKSKDSLDFAVNYIKSLQQNLPQQQPEENKKEDYKNQPWYLEQQKYRAGQRNIPKQAQLNNEGLIP